MRPRAFGAIVLRNQADRGCGVVSQRRRAGRLHSSILADLRLTEHYRFVNPQFEASYPDGKGSSCPDFVALDFRSQTVFVVEVSAAYNIAGLISRARERESRWCRPIHYHHLAHANPWFAAWRNFRTTLFVREDRFATARRAFQNDNDVSIIALESMLAPWRWEWSDGKPNVPLDLDRSGRLPAT